MRTSVTLPVALVLLTGMAAPHLAKGAVDLLEADNFDHRNAPVVEGDSDCYRELDRRLWSDGVDGIRMINFITCREREVEPDFAQLPEVSGPAPRIARPMLLVANKHSNTLSYIDPVTLAVERTIPVGPNPHELVITPDQRFSFDIGRPGRIITISPS